MAEALSINSPEVLSALRTLAQVCIDQGYDSFTWTLRNGPHDPDAGVSDWRVRVEPAPPKPTASR